MDLANLGKIVADETCPNCGLVGKMKIEKSEVIHVTNEKLDCIFCDLKCSCGGSKSIRIPKSFKESEVKQGEIKSPSKTSKKK